MEFEIKTYDSYKIYDEKMIDISQENYISRYVVNRNNFSFNIQAKRFTIFNDELTKNSLDTKKDFIIIELRDGTFHAFFEDLAEIEKRKQFVKDFIKLNTIYGRVK